MSGGGHAGRRAQRTHILVVAPDAAQPVSQVTAVGGHPAYRGVRGTIRTGDQVHGPREAAADPPCPRAFLADQLAERKLVTAGPWADDSGAPLVFDVGSEAELRELLAADPYQIAGVCEEVSLREWQPVFP